MMPFAFYMVGFLVVMASIVWAAVVVGVPQLYLGIGLLVLLGAAAIAAISKSRRRLPPREH